jgi:hypothetical protein
VFYTIRHVTRFTYEVPITESVMEARMQPRSEGAQRCVRFGLSTTPSARPIYPTRKATSSIIQHPRSAHAVDRDGQALVECAPVVELPDGWERTRGRTSIG